MSEFVDLILAIATVIAVLLAGWELRSGAQISGQTHARDAWIQYLQCGLGNPQLGSTKFAMASVDVDDVASLWQKGSLESERYWWFLDIMMEAAESLIHYFPQEEWQNTIRFNLTLHREALTFLWDDENKFYSRKLEKMVLDVIGDEEKTSLTGHYRDHPGFKESK